MVGDTKVLEWFLLSKEGIRRGPFAQEEIQAEIDKGRITNLNLMKHATEDDWSPISKYDIFSWDSNIAEEESSLLFSKNNPWLVMIHDGSELIEGVVSSATAKNITIKLKNKLSTENNKLYLHLYFQENPNSVNIWGEVQGNTSNDLSLKIGKLNNFTYTKYLKILKIRNEIDNSSKAA